MRLHLRWLSILWIFPFFIINEINDFSSYNADPHRDLLSNFKEYHWIPKNNNSGLKKLYKEILTMSSWWSIRHPLLINCLTTSKWPSADAFWSAVWPVWKKKKKVRLKEAFVLSNVWVFALWTSFLADHHLSLTTSIIVS